MRNIRLGDMAKRQRLSEEDRIAEEAAGWVARLQSHDATPQDERDFQRWLERNPAHQTAYDEFKGLWSDLRDVPIGPDRLARLRRPRRSKISTVIAIGATAVLATGLYRTGMIDRLRADHYTAVGEIRSIGLADGTRVDLNTDSAIAVRFSAGERRIELLRGEAFFDVGRDPARPFIVDDGTLTTRDIGTRYSMRRTSGASPGDVQVEQGKVEITGAGQPIVLGAGEVATLTGQGRLSVTTADVSNETAWRGGKLIFSGRRLRDVLETLERYRSGRIIILDQAAADRTVSGIFDLDDTDQALRVIEDSLPVTITRLTGLIVVVRSR